VELAEWEFAIKIKRDEPMFSRPFNSRSFCHAAKLSHSFRKKKLKKLAQSGKPGQVYMPSYEK
jgi:hypothetical protein